MEETHQRRKKIEGADILPLRRASRREGKKLRLQLDKGLKYEVRQALINTDSFSTTGDHICTI